MEVGDLVLIVDNRTPRGQWPIGVITKTYGVSSSKGSDQTVRTVVVKTDQGEFRRPVVKLCLLKKAADRKEKPASALENVTDDSARPSAT